jgi:hypothetical protein
MRHKSVRAVAVFGAVVGLLGASASLASATKADPDHKVTICHATASATNPYVVITVDIASIVGDSGHGHSGVNAGDIIPPFTMDGYTYAGNNWDTAHYPAPGCNLPGVTPPGGGNDNTNS